MAFKIGDTVWQAQLYAFKDPREIPIIRQGLITEEEENRVIIQWKGGKQERVFKAYMERAFHHTEKDALKDAITSCGLAQERCLREANQWWELMQKLQERLGRLVGT